MAREGKSLFLLATGFKPKLKHVYFCSPILSRVLLKMPEICVSHWVTCPKNVAKK